MKIDWILVSLTAAWIAVTGICLFAHEIPAVNIKSITFKEIPARHADGQAFL